MKFVQKTQHTIEREEVIRTECDWCGAEIEPPGEHGERLFSLLFLEGASFPDNGWRDSWGVDDLCNTCVERLRVFLVENKVKITTKETHW